eukprot:707185-Rhodomonas_salina.2
MAEPVPVRRCSTCGPRLGGGHVGSGARGQGPAARRGGPARGGGCVWPCPLTASLRIRVDQYHAKAKNPVPARSSRRGASLLDDVICGGRIALAVDPDGGLYPNTPRSVPDIA